MEPEQLTSLCRFVNRCLDNDNTDTQLDAGKDPIIDAEAEQTAEWPAVLADIVEHNGKRYAQVEMSCLKAMTSALLKADEVLVGHDKEIERLMTSSKEEQAELRRVYETRLAEQRDEFAHEQKTMQKTFQAVKQLMRAAYSERIQRHVDTAQMSRDECLKVQARIQDELEPELRLYRERYGPLSEFAPSGTSKTTDRPTQANVVADCRLAANVPKKKDTKCRTNKKRKRASLNEMQDTISCTAGSSATPSLKRQHSKPKATAKSIDKSVAPQKPRLRLEILGEPFGTETHLTRSTPIAHRTRSRARYPPAQAGRC